MHAKAGHLPELNSEIGCHAGLIDLVGISIWTLTPVWNRIDRHPIDVSIDTRSVSNMRVYVHIQT